VPEGRRAVVAAIAHPPLDYRSARPRTHRLPQYREREPIDRLDPALEVVAVAVASATDAGRWRRERARLSPAASSRRMLAVVTYPPPPLASRWGNDWLES
jgi:hypothetical protein